MIARLPLASVVLLVLLVATASLWPTLARSAPADAAEFVHPWRFQVEQGADAIRQGWHMPAFDDSSWAIVDFFRPWVEHSVTDADAVAWYRGIVRPRPGWSDGVIVVELRTAARLDVYVNGLPRPVDTIDADRDGERRAVVEMGQAFLPERENLIAMRFHGAADPAGPSGTVRLAPRLGVVLTPREYVRHAKQTHPNRLMPTWAEDRPTIWTVAGVPGAAHRALLGGDGAISPGNPGFTVAPWLFEHASGSLYAPDTNADFTARLHEGHIPVVHQSWTTGRARMEALFFVGRGAPELTPLDQAAPGAQKGLAHYRLTIRNPGDQPLQATLFLAVRPYDVRGAIAPIHQIAYDPEWRAVIVDEGVALRADRAADGFGATRLAETDVSDSALAGMLPPAAFAADVDGYAMGALAYRLSLAPGASETITLALPVDPLPATADSAALLSSVSFEATLQATVARWRDDLYSVRLDVPDRRLVDAYYASLAYLLMGQYGDRFHPGPLEHNAFWTRDAAYFGYALDRAGHSERVRPMARLLMAAQHASGEIPPVIERDGTHRTVVEWDAQGQTIFLLVRHYRLTRDLEFLRAAYPTIVRAADFVAELSARNADKPVPFRGILPPGLSAEDIGSGDWHHYWDDFWALAGYAEAAFAADELGDGATADRMRQLRSRLADDLIASIRHTQMTYAQPQIPNGPEDYGSSSDARGTTPALWPIEVLPEERQLVRDSFAFYHQRYIAPYDGAFKHNLDLLWPYAGLGLAQGYLRLGMTDEMWQILRWNLDHQSFPGLYAWAEGIHPDGDFGIGDMPHGWAAAETLNLIRDLLLTEDDGWLVLAAGVPADWLTGGRPIAIDFAPTLYGHAGYDMVGDLTPNGEGVSGSVRLHRLGDAAPPNGYRLVLPVDQAPASILVDGEPMPTASVGAWALPVGFRSVVVTFGDHARDTGKPPGVRR